MKKNLAKKIVLGLLTGAVLMSSSVAWAGFIASAGDNTGASTANGDWSVTVGYSNTADGDGSIAIGHSSFANGDNSIVIGSNGSGMNSDDNGYDNSIVIGSNSVAGSGNSVALGNSSEVSGTGSVALGYGSVASDDYVVSVGNGDQEIFRKIVNVKDGTNANDGATVGQMKAITGLGYTFINASQELHYINNNDDETLTGAVMALDKAVYGLEQGKADKATTLEGYGIENAYTKDDADGIFLTIDDAANTYVQIQKDNNNPDKTTTTIGDFIVEDAGTGSSSTVTINEGDKEQVVFDGDGITVGKNSTRMDSTGFYAGGAKPHDYGNAAAAIDEKGRIKGAGGKFEVGADGSVKAAGDNFNIDKDGNVTAKTVTAENLYSKEQVNELIGGSNASIAGINQRLEKTNAKINKVGAGAAALAALHPLEYDPDDKLTFSAGMGNYAGENAAALGAFYRPNEKFMVSLGGTMGNGENMVNLGLSIGLDKPNGYAKLSKRELIQKVNAMEAKYEAVEAEKEAMKAEMAEMKAMLQAILAKK